MDGLHNSRMGSQRKELTAPCKGCKDRFPGCHDACERYQAFCRMLSQKKDYERQHYGKSLWDPMAPKYRREL